MIRQPIQRKWTIALGVASVILLIGVYVALSARQHQINPNDTTVPTLKQIGGGVAKAFQPRTKKFQGTLREDGTIEPGRQFTSFFYSWVWTDSAATLGRLASGLMLGALGAVVLGIMMGCYAPVAAFFSPSVAFLAKIPPTAMLALFFIVVGSGFGLYVAMIAFGILPTLAQAVYFAARENVPDELVDKARTLGASQVEIIWNVITRQIMPVIIESVRLQVGPAMVFLIAAEWAIGNVGFGYRLKIQSRLLDMSVVYVYLALLGLFGFFIDQAARFALRRLCPWSINA